MNKEFNKVITKIKNYKVLSDEQLNNIYFVSCLKDIQENKEDDDYIEDYQPLKQFVTDLISILEMKEEYEICASLMKIKKHL